MNLPDDWRAALAAVGGPALDASWAELCAFVAAERAAHRVHPPDSRVTAAFHATPFAAVRVVLLGQDPYPTAGQACGLSFSVLPGTPTPASLQNLFRELEADLGVRPPPHGWLGAWAERGVLLLNTVLTVRDGEPGSHAARGWEKFTDLVLDALDRRAAPCVFVLLGGPARKKRARLQGPQHRVLEGVHPSPLSANAGFFGSRPFRAIDALLTEVGGRPMDWSLPEDPGVVEVVRDRDPSLDAIRAWPPPPAALAKLLDLPVWRGLTEGEAGEVATALEGVLPAPFVVDAVGPGARGPRVTFARGRERYVLVPGGAVELGFKGVKAKLSTPRRRKLEQEVGVAAEDLLAGRATPPRPAVIPPFLAAVDAVPASAWTPADPGRDAVAATDAALRAQGLSLPTPDEWEYLHSAGERTWFWWGMEWPTDRAEAPVTPFGTSFAPDAALPEWTADPFRWRAGGEGLPDAAAELRWAPSLEGNALARPELARPARGRVRPIRRVFPYAVR
jgi:uracil-DNA glycosylase